MSRAEELRTAMDAELEVVELEEALLAQKGEGGADREIKLALRDARQRFRELRAGAPGEGDAVAEPGTVETTAKAKGV